MELLVVITVIGILAAMLLPVLSRAKQRAQGIYCVNNTKQLMVALHLYADDANGWLPPNPDWATNRMWVQGEMENPNDATNVALLKQSLLAPYDGGSIKIFKCPGDASDHVRTYSMSQAVGTKPGVLAAVDGPWLDGTRHHEANHPWRTYGRFSDMIQPDPSDLWVFMDENQYNINDGAFAVSMTTPTEIIDWPGTYHNRSAGIAFADGHSEIHKWRDGRTQMDTRINAGPHIQTPANPDILWLQSKTSARMQ
jgi:prepilin-type processing-associated H-X9-DG protein